MRRVRIYMLISVILIAMSCGPRVSTVNPEGTSLSNYNTFAYLPNSNSNLIDKKYKDQNVNRAIVEGVKTHLQNSGLRIDRDNPDLLVLISTATDTEIGTTTEPVYATYPYTTRVGTISPYYEPYYYRGYAGYNNIIGYDRDIYRYKEGTLIVHLIDRNTKRTVWKGVATNTIYDQPATNAISRMVDDIFEEFPLAQN